MVKFFELRSPTKRFRAKSQPPRSRGDVERWSKVPREALHEVNRVEYDRIIAKLGERGEASLTDDERSTLDNFSNRTYR